MARIDLVRVAAAFGRRYCSGVRCAALGVLLCALTGCATVVDNAVGGLTDGLSSAVLNSDDPETVRAGVPTLLLILDGLIEQSPQNVDLLAAGAQLNSAYGGAFVSDEARAIKFAVKAFDYSQRSICAHDQSACGIRTTKFQEFEAWLSQQSAEDLPYVYALGTSWAGLIQANSSDWNAIAELSRVRAIMDWAVALDPAYDLGGPHLYLGVLDTLVPPAMGGKPDEGRAHFEKAIELSGGRFLMTKVMFAQQYGRLVYDRDLHDRLLQEVVSADPAEPGQTLTNIIAQERARALLESGDDYF